MYLCYALLILSIVDAGVPWNDGLPLVTSSEWNNYIQIRIQTEYIKYTILLTYCSVAINDEI